MDVYEIVEQSNFLITSITFNMPQLVLVIGDESGRALYMNYAAQLALQSDNAFLPAFMETTQAHARALRNGHAVEFAHQNGEGPQYYTVVAYPVCWKKMNAKAYILNNISAERGVKKTGWEHMNRDSLTKLHNRLAGIMTFNKWLDMQKEFVLCFANLDNLKYINDTFGREEGDKYITRAANQLMRFSPDSVISRAGGDEFMILAPGFTQAEAEERIREITRSLQSETEDNPFYYNISCGMVEIGADNSHSASSLLAMADENMWASKFENKRKRSLNL